MRLIINLQTGNVGIGADSAPVPSKAHLHSVIATPEQEALIAQGGPFRWTPDDPEDPKGPGTLAKAEITPPVPNEIPMWRARAVMRTTEHGDGTLYDAVLAAVAALPDPDKIIAEETLNGTVLARNSALLQSLASGLGLSPEDVDNLILAASQLPG